MTQSQALSLLKTGANVFLTGEPGAGKTHTANEYVRYLRSCGIETAVTASTGIAATHLGGMTIHSWSGIGVKTALDKRDLESIAKSKHVATRVRRARILIIEEISMLSGGTLSLVDMVCRRIKQSVLPFGGIQVVLVGDFFQLPPIVRQLTQANPQLALIQQTPAARFAYDAPAWKELKPTVCYITEQHRQDDNTFLALLSAIRRNAFGASHLNLLNTRKIPASAAPSGVPKLFSRNVDVDRVNEEVLSTLHGMPRMFAMTSHGPSALVSTLQKWCLSPAELFLKVGAAVMFTKNNQKEGFVNGTLGVVEKFDAESGLPIVRTRSGKRITVDPMDWVFEENGETRAKISQLPLRLAWALTVHKSQGMSLDEAVVDLADVFEFGQGYVALSRVRRLSGLHLLGWNERAFHVHPAVLAQDSQFRALSQESAYAFATISQSDVLKAQQLFIHACRGYAREGAREKGSGEKKPTAFHPWDEEDDAQLRELYLGGASIADLSDTFSRTAGSIRSRLIKYKLLEK